MPLLSCPGDFIVAFENEMSTALKEAQSCINKGFWQTQIILVSNDIRRSQLMRKGRKYKIFINFENTKICDIILEKEM